LQLLHELIPNAARFGVLTNPAELSSVIAELQAAARTLGLQLVVVNARTDTDLETAFAQRPRQCFPPSWHLRRAHSQLETAFATLSQQRVGFREHALAGGLMS
jgi:putative ABC transport system substrate-binding protein